MTTTQIPAQIAPNTPNTTFAWPETMPADEAQFVTEGKGTFVEARVAAVRLGQDTRGGQRVELALRVLDGQQANRLSDSGRIDSGTSDVGGEYVLGKMSLNGDAPKVTFASLRAFGYSPLAAAEAYETDKQAQALRTRVAQQAAGQQLSPADLAAKQDEVCGMLALSRGGATLPDGTPDYATRAAALKACGLDRTPARLVVLQETFTPAKGDPSTTVRLKYVNPIPRAANEDDLVAFVLSRPGASAPAKLTPPGRNGGPAGGSSPPPNADNVDF